MAVGDGSLFGGFSYIAIGRETTFGTYVTCTANMDFISAAITTTKENKILEQIECSRTYSKRISLGRVIEGDVEGYFYPRVLSSGYLMQNAFGGTITSITATGETASGLGFQHTFEIGAMDQSYPSLCINMRKGDSSGAKIFEYSGVRVNEMNFTAELDEALKFTTSLMCKDSSQTANDVKSALTVSSALPLSFVSGRVSVETTFAALTSTSFWHVQSVSFGIQNSLKGDSESRRIGSDVLDVLPAGIATIPLTVTLRYDTTTAYDAMLNATELSCQLEFTGDTMTTSVIKEGLKFNFPSVRVTTAGDPEIGGPDSNLTSEVTFHVLRDDSSAGGYAVQAILTNDTASYA